MKITYLVGRIRAGGICVRVVETVCNSSKGGETEKRGGNTKIFKKWGKLNQGLGALKRGSWNPLAFTQVVITQFSDQVKVKDT